MPAVINRVAPAEGGGSAMLLLLALCGTAAGIGFVLLARALAVTDGAPDASCAGASPASGGAAAPPCGNAQGRLGGARTYAKVAGSS